MSRLRSFGRFWWSFVVGDDWRVAVGVVVVLVLTWFLAHGEANPWWLLPIAVVVLLAFSLWRETRRAHR